MVKNKWITPLQANREMLAITKTSFPNDALLIGTWEHIVSLTEQYDRGDLTKERFNELVNMAWDRHRAADHQRRAEYQQQHDAQRRAAAAAAFGAAFRPPVNCTSYNLGGRVVTNCR